MPHIGLSVLEFYEALGLKKNPHYLILETLTLISMYL